MQINFPLQFNMEFFLADGSTLVQSHDGQVYRKPLPNYNSDGLTVHSKNVDFLNDENFVKAYQAGMSSGHIIGGVEIYILNGEFIYVYGQPFMLVN